jgi:hypothetical protein
LSNATVPNPKDAQYHAVKPTASWRDFQAAMAAKLDKTAAQRAARDAQRKRETTYARGELGGH